MRSIQKCWQTRRLNSANPCHSRGVTLIEILLIVILLAIFIAICVRIYSSFSVQKKPVQTEQGILIIENAMKFYKLDNGFYPTTSQGIAALVTKPKTKPVPQHWKKYLKTIPLDKNGKPYHYKNSGQNDEIEIESEAQKSASSAWGF